MEYNCKMCEAKCLTDCKCTNGIKEIDIGDGNIVKIQPQENINGFKSALEKDGTRYDILTIPFKGELGCGYIDTTNAFLVIDGLNRSAYAFGCGYLAPSYVHEKLLKNESMADARNLTLLIRATINHIISLRGKES